MIQRIQTIFLILFVISLVTSFFFPVWQKIEISDERDPAPVDMTLTSGRELYSLPLLTTATSVTLPFTIIGLNSANLPFSIVTLGITSLSRVVEP